MAHKLFDSLQDFKPAPGKAGKLYSLPALERASLSYSRLPDAVIKKTQSALSQIQ